MRYLATSFLILIFACCSKEEAVLNYYNKYDVVMQYRTNISNVSMAYTSNNKQLLNGVLSAPGFDYMFNEMQTGDIIYVYATSSDTGYIDLSLEINDELVYATKSVYDSSINRTVNTFYFALP